MSPIDILIRAILENKGFQDAAKAQDALKASSASATKEAKSGLDAATKAARDLEKTTKSAAGGLDDIGKASAGLSQSIKQGIGIDVGRRVVDGLVDAIQSGIQFNALIEQQTIAFETLLGSATAAQDRVAMLFDFAARTPFEFEEVINADRVLQSLTKGALASAEGLRIVGDTAAATARPLSEISMWIGRVYGGLKSGTPIGEATLRLIEMGAITGDQARKLNALAESGEAMGKAFEVVQQIFAKNAGAMDKQSHTFNGNISTLKDNLKQLTGIGTKDFFDTLTVGLEKLNELLTKPALKEGIKSILDHSIVGASKAAGKGSADLAAAGGISGAFGLMSAGGDGGGDGGAGMQASIARYLRAKREAGEMDEAEISRLTLKLGLIMQLEDVEQRRAQLMQMGMQLRGSGRAGSVSVAGLPSEEDIDAAFTQYIKAQEKQIEADKAFYEIQDRMEAEAMEATEKRLARETEDLHAFNETMQHMETERLQAQQKQTQKDQDALRVKRDEIALQRTLLDADFRTPEVAKKGERVKLLQQEIDALGELIKKLEQRRDLESDAAAREALNQQVNGLGGERRGLMAQQAGMKAEADPFSFNDQFRQSVTQLQDQWGTAAEQMATSFKDVFNGAIQTISQGITGLIMGTLTWGQALRQIGMTILTSIVEAIVMMGVRWIATQIMMAIAGKALQASMVAANAPLAAASAAIWATPATLATIASYGGAAAAAPGFIAMSQGLVMAQSMAGFKEGGYTGDGGRDDVAGLAHKGEFYFTAPQTAAIGRENLATLARTGTMNGRGWSGAGPALAQAMQASGGSEIDASVHVAMLKDSSAVRDWVESTEGRKVLIDVISGAKMELGIQT